MSVGLLAASLFASLGTAALVTIATEVVVVGLLGWRRPQELGIVALANLATNPAVNLLLAGAMALASARTLADPAVLASLVALELAATLAEWRIYRYALPDHRHHALRVSVMANAVSLVVGFVVFGCGAPIEV